LSISPLFPALDHHNFNIDVLKNSSVTDLLSAQGKREFAWHNDCLALAARHQGLSLETKMLEKVQGKTSVFCQRKLVMDNFQGDFKQWINLLNLLAHISIANQM